MLSVARKKIPSSCNSLGSEDDVPGDDVDCDEADACRVESDDDDKQSSCCAAEESEDWPPWEQLARYEGDTCCSM